ncbi:hypothetical protein CARUB_v10028035mg [Capsella rubella]|uniref:Zinc finger PHD-type domain-containing protein n=1 Tax=Capsella rubella TaxID=81985 RepID=R0GU81_9BRAS|nr:hypothetical protein CARUB_v10028035mg [Capsella rubella]
MDVESGHEAGSEASQTSSGSELSLAEKPCEICGTDANEDEIMTCFRCKDTREHIYCTRVKKEYVPLTWICDDCSSDGLVTSNLRSNRVVACTDQTAYTSSRTRHHQVVDRGVQQATLTSMDLGLFEKAFLLVSQVILIRLL